MDYIASSLDFYTSIYIYKTTYVRNYVLLLVLLIIVKVSIIPSYYSIKKIFIDLHKPSIKLNRISAPIKGQKTKPGENCINEN